MSDFDFDELDKAVAGALETDTPSTSQANATRDVGAPEPVKDAPTPEPVKQPVTPPAIRRASGRFMDVVHPSSDMRSSRPGFTAPAAKPVNERESNDEDELIEAKLISDPSELDSLSESSSPVGEWSKPLESPFLPDTKVEKRPLGGNAEAETFASLFEATNNEPLLEAPDEPRLEATTMPDPIDFAAHSMALPSENEDTGATEEAEEPSDAEEVSAEVPTAEKAEEPVTAVEPVGPVGPTSITQQYTEQQSTEEPSGAIYDTENYHQPLAHDGKKHSSVWTILGIILLVLLGAGAGVAFYFFILPNF